MKLRGWLIQNWSLVNSLYGSADSIPLKEEALMARQFGGWHILVFIRQMWTRESISVKSSATET